MSGPETGEATRPLVACVDVDGSSVAIEEEEPPDSPGAAIRRRMSEFLSPKEAIQRVRTQLETDLHNERIREALATEATKTPARQRRESASRRPGSFTGPGPDRSHSGSPGVGSPSRFGAAGASIVHSPMQLPGSPYTPGTGQTRGHSPSPVASVAKHAALVPVPDQSPDTVEGFVEKYKVPRVKWSDVYRHHARNVCDEREERRRIEAEQVASYVPRFTTFPPPDLSTVIDRPALVWDDAVTRHTSLCIICWTQCGIGASTLSCNTCNVVAHAMCVKQAPSIDWFCPNCFDMRDVVEAEVKRRKNRVGELFQENLAARKLQSFFLMARQRRKFLYVRSAVRRMQAKCRMKLARSKVERKFGKEKHPFKVRIRHIVIRVTEEVRKALFHGHFQEIQVERPKTTDGAVSTTIGRKQHLVYVEQGANAIPNSVPGDRQNANSIEPSFVLTLTLHDNDSSWLAGGIDPPQLMRFDVPLQVERVMPADTDDGMSSDSSTESDLTESDSDDARSDGGGDDDDDDDDDNGSGDVDSRSFATADDRSGGSDDDSRTRLRTGQASRASPTRPGSSMTQSRGRRRRGADKNSSPSKRKGRRSGAAKSKKGKGKRKAQGGGRRGGKAEGNRQSPAKPRQPSEAAARRKASNAFAPSQAALARRAAIRASKPWHKGQGVASRPQTPTTDNYHRSGAHQQHRRTYHGDLQTGRPSPSRASLMQRSASNVEAEPGLAPERSQGARHHPLMRRHSTGTEPYVEERVTTSHTVSSRGSNTATAEADIQPVATNSIEQHRFGAEQPSPTRTRSSSVSRGNSSVGSLSREGSREPRRGEDRSEDNDEGGAEVDPNSKMLAQLASAATTASHTFNGRRNAVAGSVSVLQSSLTLPVDEVNELSGAEPDSTIPELMDSLDDMKTVVNSLNRNTATTDSPGATSSGKDGTNLAQFDFPKAEGGHGRLMRETSTIGEHFPAAPAAAAGAGGGGEVRRPGPIGREKSFSMEKYGSSLVDIVFRPERSVFTVSNLNCQVLVVLTVSRTYEPQRSFCIGQAMQDSFGHLMWRRVAQCHQVLRGIQIEPKLDDSFLSSRLFVKANPFAKGKGFPGYMSWALFPGSNVTSRCGYLLQLMSSVALSGKKKVWVSLLDTALMLFARKADKHPTNVVNLRKCEVRMMNDDKLIEVRPLDKKSSPFYFTHQKTSELADWARKLLGVAQNK